MHAAASNRIKSSSWDKIFLINKRYKKGGTWSSVYVSENDNNTSDIELFVVKGIGP